MAKIWLRDSLDHLWCIKGADESSLRVDSSAPLIYHDPSDLGSLVLIRIIPKERAPSFVYQLTLEHTNGKGLLCRNWFFHVYCQAVQCFLAINHILFYVWNLQISTTSTSLNIKRLIVFLVLSRGLDTNPSQACPPYFPFRPPSVYQRTPCS